MTTVQNLNTQAQPSVSGRVTPWGVLRSEWLKLASLRSTYWLAGITIAGSVTTAGMFALLFRMSLAEMTDPAGQPIDSAEMAGPGPGFVAISVVSTALVTIAILAVLAITSEYSSGSIRTTFTSVPSRQRVLGAKTVIIVLLSGVVTLISAALSWLVMRIIYPAGFSVEGNGLLTVVGGSALYLMAIAAFAVGVGALVRSSAAAMSIVLGLFLILEQVVLVVAMVNSTVANIAAYLPSTAGSLITGASISGEMLRSSGAPELTAWQGFGVLMIWVVVVYSLGALRLQKGDA